MRTFIPIIIAAFLSACGGTMQAHKRVEGQVVVDVPAPRAVYIDNRGISCAKPGPEVDEGEAWAARGTTGGGTAEVSGRRVFRAEKGTAYGGGGYGYYNESGTRCYYLSEVEAVKSRDRR